MNESKRNIDNKKPRETRVTLRIFVDEVNIVDVVNGAGVVAPIAK